MSDTATILDIVLPTHDVGPWLADALESLLGQSLTSWHAYLVLDGCTDDSEKIARDFAARDARFSVHEAEKQGVGHARNLGFALGNAPYVAFIDPDDLVPARALAALTSSLERTGSDLATGHAVQFRDPSSDWPYWTMQSGLFAAGAEATNVCDEPRLILDHTTWNKVYRRAFLAGRGILFPEDVAIGEDAHHTLEAICAAKTIDVIPATVYRHRVRPGSLTGMIRNAASVTEWVTMTRGIESLVRSVDAPAVTAVWLKRMLEHEAWTRARQVGNMQSDESLDSLLTLLHDLIASVPSATWASYPLVIRWSYDALGVTATQPGDVDNDLAAMCIAGVVELRAAANLPELTRFERDLKMSGPTLRAHVWRESLLMPFLRVIDRLSSLQRRRALAHVLTFHDTFVASHMLLPGETRILALARAQSYDHLEHWATIGRVLGGSAVITGATLGHLSIDTTMQLPGSTSGDLTVVAVSLGKIAGLTRQLGTLVPGAGLTDAARPAVGAVRVSALRPFGRWSIGFLTGEATGDVHFVPLTLSAAAPSRLPALLCTVIPVSAVYRPLVLESRAPAPHRAVRKLMRHRVTRGILRRGRAAISRFGRRAPSS
ncbi:MAG: glycosyltransferase [Cryobacterium sp.]